MSAVHGWWHGGGISQAIGWAALQIRPARAVGAGTTCSSKAHTVQTSRDMELSAHRLRSHQRRIETVLFPSARKTHKTAVCFLCCRPTWSKPLRWSPDRPCCTQDCALSRCVAALSPKQVFCDGSVAAYLWPVGQGVASDPSPSHKNAGRMCNAL